MAAKNKKQSRHLLRWILLFLLLLILGIFIHIYKNTSPHEPVDPSGERDIKLHHMVADTDPTTAFAYLEKLILHDPEIENDCHDSVHEIGHAAYEKFGFTESMKYQSDLCGSGYIHRVVESYFEEHKGEEINPLTLCSKTDGRCFHGLGHGYMFYFDYDLHNSVEACEQLPAGFARGNCLDGVFMQYFSTGDAATLTDTSFDICDLFNGYARGSCYFYAPRYHLVYPDLYTGVYSLCKKLPNIDRAGCIKGIGSGLTKYNITRLNIPENFCFQLEPADERACVSGILSYYIVHYNDHQKGKDVCSSFSQEHSIVCESEYSKKKTVRKRVE